MDSALVRAIRGEQAYWTWGTELQAATFDAVQRLAYYLLAVNGVKDAKEPQPYPRPGSATKPEPERVTLAGLNSFLQGGTDG